MAEKVNVDKALDINKDGFSNGGIDIETPGQNLERDPRTKTLANGMQPCLLYTSPSPRDVEESRMPSSA